MRGRVEEDYLPSSPESQAEVPLKRSAVHLFFLPESSHEIVLGNIIEVTRAVFDWQTEAVEGVETNL